MSTFVEHYTGNVNVSKNSSNVVKCIKGLGLVDLKGVSVFVLLSTCIPPNMVEGCRTYLMGTILLLEERHTIMGANLLTGTPPTDRE